MAGRGLHPRRRRRRRHLGAAARGLCPWRRGAAGRIIERVEWSGPASIALATPILMPHTIVGRSLFDQTQDLQQLGSVLTRGLLDNLYLVNRPRPVISDHVNIDSLIDWMPGSPIRLQPGARPGDNHVAWLQVPNVTGGALSALEHLATVRENRTGVSRYNQGLDAESLNKTLGGLDRIMSAAQPAPGPDCAHLRGDRDQAALSPDLSRHQARGDRPGRLLAARAAPSPAAIPASGPTTWTCRSTSWASAIASRRSAISP